MAFASKPRLLALIATTAILSSTPVAHAATDCEDIATPAAWGYSPTLSLLADGRILLVGGRHHDSHDYLARAEIMDLGTRKFTPVASMGSRRAMHSALSLPDGRVLVAGGAAKPVEVYDPVTNAWTRIGSMRRAATGVAVTPTRDGKVLIVGGDIGHKGVVSNEALLWDLKGKLKTAQSGDAFAGGAFMTRNHGVLFLGYQDGNDASGSKLWTRNQDTGELAPFDRDRQLVEALLSLPSGMQVMRTTDGRLVEPPMAYDGMGLAEFRAHRWEKTVAFNRDHLDPAVLHLPSGDVLVAGSSDGPLPVELCHRPQAAGSPRQAGEPSRDDAGSVDKRLGRDFGDRCFVHIKAERWDAAQAECERGLAVAKDAKLLGALHFNMGRIAEGRGNIEDARAHYRKSLEMRPDNAPTQERLRALVLAGGCTKNHAESHRALSPARDAGAKPPAQPALDKGAPVEVGMEDPFAPPSAEAKSGLKAGKKALQAKKLDEARAAFAAVVAVAPDNTEARFLEIKAAIAGGHFDEVAPLWRELLARDFVAYAGRLDSPAEFSDLRTSAHWKGLRIVVEQVKVAYATGLDKELIFIARSAYPRPVPPNAEKPVKLELHQEIYHFDVARGRYRRLTDTGGKVIALKTSPKQKEVSFFVAGRMAKGPQRFLDAKVGTVDLTTLATTGPYALPVDPKLGVDMVVLQWTNSEMPFWMWIEASGGRGARAVTGRFTGDRKAIMASEGGIADAHWGETRVYPFETLALEPSEVTTMGGGTKPTSFTIKDESKPVRANRELSLRALVESPNRQRIAYAGVFTPCPTGDTENVKNELFVWDRPHQAATRVSSAMSEFNNKWIDDDHLAYENAPGMSARVAIFDMVSRKAIQLKPRAGSALVGFNALVCRNDLEGDDD